MSEPLTDEELASIEQEMRDPAAYSVEAELLQRLVAEVRRLRAENAELQGQNAAERKRHLESYLNSIDHVRKLMDALEEMRVRIN